MNPDEWSEWTDVLGQKYQTGDVVAYAALRYKSPEFRFGRVVRINRLRKNGDEITSVTWDYRTQKYRKRPSCTVTVEQFVRDKEGIWGVPEGKWVNGEYIEPDVKISTWQKPENIMRIAWGPNGAV